MRLIGVREGSGGLTVVDPEGAAVAAEGVPDATGMKTMRMEWMTTRRRMKIMRGVTLHHHVALGALVVVDLSVDHTVAGGEAATVVVGAVE